MAIDIEINLVSVGILLMKAWYIDDTLLDSFNSLVSQSQSKFWMRRGVDDDNHFSSWHVIGPRSRLPHSHWCSLTASDQTEWHDIMGTQGYWLFLFSWRRVGGREELWCREDGTWWGSQEDSHYREQYLRLPGSSSYFVPGSDLISPDQTLSAPRVTRLIRHQTGDSAGSSPLQELTRRQFVARVSDPPSHKSILPGTRSCKHARVHTQGDLGLTGDLLSIN